MSMLLKMASSSKEKAYWTSEDVETFCKLCVEEIEKGNRPTSKKRDGWTGIINKFEELRGKRYDKSQMKNKWDNLKEECKRWRQLVLHEIGLGWDPRKKTIDASDEWWESKIQQTNPKLKVFKMKGIHPDLQVLLDRMFIDTVATGGITWNPTQGLCVDEDVEVTRLDVGDDAGSTDENLECHVAEKIVEPSGSQSRKRTGQSSSTKQSRGKKGKKLGAAADLSRQIDRLCSAVESRSPATVTSQANEGFDPYKDLIDMIDAIPEIAQDEKLYFFALSHFKEKKDNRQVFMNLKGDALKVKYLKYEMGELSRS